MDFDGLRAFLAVARHGSFSVAADELHVTQPAISKRVALLEDRLRCRLFDRIGRTIALTEAGEALLPRATVILREVEDTRRAMLDRSGTVAGTLSLATSHHIGLWRLPPTLKRFSAHYPDVTLDLQFLDSEVAFERVLRGDTELAVITLPPTPNPRLAVHQVWQDDLVFVCATGHELTRTAPVSLAMLSAWPAILPDTTTFTGRIIEGLFAEADLPLDVTMTTNYLETIKMLISIGLGWSVLPATMLDADTRAIDVEATRVSRPLGLVHHVRRTLSRAAAAFMNELLAERNTLPGGETNGKHEDVPVIRPAPR